MSQDLHKSFSQVTINHVNDQYSVINLEGKGTLSWQTLAGVMEVFCALPYSSWIWGRCMNPCFTLTSSNSSWNTEEWISYEEKRNNQHQQLQNYPSWSTYIIYLSSIQVIHTYIFFYLMCKSCHHIRKYKILFLHSVFTLFQ